MVYAVGGMEGNDTATVETVRNYWNCFAAGWRRKHPAYPRALQSPLAEEMKLPAKKRPTRFANKSHLQGSLGRKIGLNIKSHQQE